MNKTNWINYWNEKNIWTESNLWKKNNEIFFRKTSNIFNDPKHEYTQTLLKAIPEPDPKGREERKFNRLNS